MLPVIILTAVGWLYVVILMSFSETSFVAGIMTFLLYGVLPLSIILYIFDAPRRRRQRALREEEARRMVLQNHQPSPQVNEQTASTNDSGTLVATILTGQAIGVMMASSTKREDGHENPSAKTTLEKAQEERHESSDDGKSCDSSAGDNC